MRKWSRVFVCDEDDEIIDFNFSEQEKVYEICEIIDQALLPPLDENHDNNDVNNGLDMKMIISFFFRSPILIQLY